jgi:hypothetical protein
MPDYSQRNERLTADIPSATDVWWQCCIIKKKKKEKNRYQIRTLNLAKSSI